MSFRLVSKSVTLNDLERRNGPYFALFHRICLRCRRKKSSRLLPYLLMSFLFGVVMVNVCSSVNKNDANITG